MSIEDAQAPVADAAPILPLSHRSRSLLEPMIIVAIIITALIISRRRDYRILRWSNARRRIYSSASPPRSGRSSEDSQDTLINSRSRNDSTEQLLRLNSEKDDERIDSPPNGSSRHANYLHSRLLQKFPFLVEMFYFWLNYIAYKSSKQLTAVVYGIKAEKVAGLARAHGESILSLEHHSFAKIFFPISEVGVQRFFLQDHETFMTFLDKAYSLVHIPGTMAFLAWYYYTAPSHASFSTMRRTMTLGNFLAFLIFALWPCMPPRLLPSRYGFVDTVRAGHDESFWVGDAMDVNQFAAMPSLHFTYALVIGCTLFWHSGFLQRLRSKKAVRLEARGTLGMLGCMTVGIAYPSLVLLVIVATANHYYLDALVATVSVVACFFCNRVWLILLPVEDFLLKVLLLRKPEPTTGERERRRIEEKDDGRGEEEEEGRFV